MHSPLEYDPYSVTLEAGQMIVNEANVTHLRERIEHLIERAQYYEEVPVGKTHFIDIMTDLKQTCDAIIRTGHVV